MPIAPKPWQSRLETQDSPSVPIWHRDITSIFKPRYTAKTPFRELSVFCRKLSFLLGAGIPIKSALSIVSEQSPGRVLAKILPGITARVTQGESFSQAARDSRGFPEFFCGFVSIGETTAQLPQVMEQLADFYETQAETRDELTAALVYPLAVTLMMLGVIVLAVTFVLPGYSRIFDASGVELPAMTRGLLRVSEFMAARFIVIMVGFFIIFLGVIFFAQSSKGRWFFDRLYLRLSITRLGVNFRLTQALHLLLLAGLSVSQALPFAEAVMGNVKVQTDLARISAQLKMGKPFWEALAEMGYIDPLLVGLSRVGEEAGRLPQTIEKCQSYYAQSYRRAIKRLNKLVEPMITLILGVGLGIIMLAIILPTFELAMVM